MKCVNLRKRFPKFLSEYETPEAQSERDPWLLVMKCRNGEVSPHGGNTLEWYSERHGRLVKRSLRDVPSARHHLDGDECDVVHFHVRDFPLMRTIIKPLVDR